MERKIDKDAVIIVAANIILILFAAWCFFGCATKNKSVNVTETESIKSGSLDNQIVHDVDIKSVNQFNGFTMSDFAQAASWMNWAYNGNAGDEFSLAINQTATGYEMKTKGSGTANAGETNDTSKYVFEVYTESKLDSVVNQFSKLQIKYDELERNYERIKSIDKKVKGVQAGVYIGGVILLIVVIFIVWLDWRIRKFGSSFRAFIDDV